MSATFAKFHPNLILGGTYSGQIVLWDNRVGQKKTPVQRSPLSSSGHTHPDYCMKVVGTQNAYNLAKTLMADGWTDDGGDDVCEVEVDDVKSYAPGTNPVLMSIDEEELATQAAMDCINDPGLLPGDAAVRRGLKRGQANWVGILRRKILDGGTIDRLPVKSESQTRYI